METNYMPEAEDNSFQRLVRLINKAGLSKPVICDVGANIGQSIEKFITYWPEASIHSFEANPGVFSQLSANYAHHNNIQLNPIALSDSIGELSFYATRVTETSSLLPPTQEMINLSSEKKYDYEKIRVPSETLDHYCDSQGIQHIDLLKIDVQGAEMSVLKGAKSLLKNDAVSSIYIETTFADCYENQSQLTDILIYLKQVWEEFVLWDISPFLYTSRDQLWATNSILISPSMAASLLK